MASRLGASYRPTSPSGPLRLIAVVACAGLAATLAWAADSNTTVPSKRPPDQELAQTLWNQSCAPCHGAKGLGDGALAAPLGGVASLSGRITDQTMNDLVDRVRKGDGKMPAYSETIDVGDTRRILEWIRDVSSGKIQPKAGAAAKPTKPAPHPKPVIEPAAEPLGG
ncbi:MAG: cytochrome c [Myxococcales bacterium]|nr:cytochrome c [Myxococcales bacterium]